jgi:CspA family cold shock protein
LGPFRAKCLVGGELQQFQLKFGSRWLARSVDCMAKGTVKWFNEKKGFGFIVDPEVPTDIFVHFSVIQADGFKTLNEGETVEYELYRDEKGAKARNVMRV